MKQKQGVRQLITKIACVWAVLMPSTAYAEPLVIQDWFITDFRGASEFIRGDIWTGRFASYDGTLRDVTGFYTAETLSFHTSARMGRVFDKGAVWVNLYYDNGYRSPLLTSDPVSAIGLGFLFHDTRFSALFNINGALVRGGKTTEYPCYDILRRQYHCGTGLIWNESHPIHLTHPYITQTQLTLSMKF